MDKLSGEIILEILSSSVQFSSLFNYSLTLGHLSPWARALRHKKALILVCKRWHNIATPLLYQNVVLRRSGQLHALVHTLINSLRASLIEEITIAETCYVYGATTPVLLQNLQILLQLCTKVTTFRFQGLNRLEIEVGWLMALPRLAHLSLGSGLTTEQKGAILNELSETLITLDISLFPHDEFESSFEFTRLRELKVYIKPPPSDPEDDPGLFTDGWDLPSLRSFVISFSDLKTAFDYRKFVRAVVEDFGKSIEYLGIHGAYLPNLQDIINSCPNVTRLAIDYLQPNGFTRRSGESGYPVVDLKELRVFDRPQDWKEAKEAITNYPPIKLLRYFSVFNYENIFHPSASVNIDPIQIFIEGFSWMAPDLNLRIDQLPQRLVTDFSQDFQGTCVYVVHQPSEYHPSADKWGLPSILDELEHPMFANDSKKQVTVGEDTAEEADSDLDEVDSDSESSMSETSHESGCTESWKIEELV